jgi:hypothetical protein
MGIYRADVSTVHLQLNSHVIENVRYTFSACAALGRVDQAPMAVGSRAALDGVPRRAEDHGNKGSQIQYPDEKTDATVRTTKKSFGVTVC